MRVLVLYNPVAGAGRSAGEADRLRAALERAGHDAALLESRVGAETAWLQEPLAGRELLVVVGGDGAMRLASGAAASTGTPVYHYPLGTENLFARQFGVERSPERLLAAIQRFQLRRLDMGFANGRRFLLMASMGFDAEVIHDLAQRRGRAISHLSYVPPIIRRIRRWRPPRLTVGIDGETVVDGARGCVVVANSRQYAVRIDPAPRASMTDGKLDVIFFPMKSRWSLLRWIIACRLRRHLSARGLLYRLGREVRVQADDAQLYQLDGDPPDDGQDEAGRTSDLRISLRPGVLPVLLP